MGCCRKAGEEAAGAGQLWPGAHGKAIAPRGDRRGTLIWEKARAVRCCHPPIHASTQVGAVGNAGVPARTPSCLRRASGLSWASRPALYDEDSSRISHPLQGGQESVYSTYSMPGIVLKSFLVAPVRGGNYYSLHFTGRETEAREVTCPGPTASNCRVQGLNTALPGVVSGPGPSLESEPPSPHPRSGPFQLVTVVGTEPSLGSQPSIPGTWAHPHPQMPGSKTCSPRSAKFIRP